MPQGSARTFVTTASPGGRTRVVEGSAAPEPSTLRQDRNDIYDADAKYRSSSAFSAAERERLKRARDAALGITPPQPQQPVVGLPLSTGSVRGGRPALPPAPPRTAPSRRTSARSDAKGPPSPRSSQSNPIVDTAPSSPRRGSREATSPRGPTAAAQAPAPISPPAHDMAASPAGSSSGESYSEDYAAIEHRPPAFPDHAGTFSLFSSATFPFALARSLGNAPTVDYSSAPPYIPWGAPSLWPRIEPEPAVPAASWQPRALCADADAAGAARAASAAALAGLHAQLPPVAVRRPSQSSFDIEAARAAARAALAPRGSAAPPPGDAVERAESPNASSIRRFAASDFLPNGARSLPHAEGIAMAGDVDARMRSLRAA